ncbi:MAG: efflux RND transporter permease subunit, partial [Bacteroidetes bacterium]|nr:efflux RND transporter permease subunit [Bacteroidota bacterium]
GIAIAIGTMVDMGIVLSESMVKNLEEAPEDEPLLETIYHATVEVASAIITAVATTVISFLPVFTMEAAEGKLFRPLAYTKTFALIASIIVAITIIPPLAHVVFSFRLSRKTLKMMLNIAAITGGLFASFYVQSGLAIILIFGGIIELISQWAAHRWPERERAIFWSKNILYALVVMVLLTRIWMPLGVNNSLLTNSLFVGIIIGG